LSDNQHYFKKKLFSFQVAALPRGAKVEIEAIAIVGDIVEETIED
jgi:hypothetical protein